MAYASKLEGGSSLALVKDLPIEEQFSALAEVGIKVRYNYSALLKKCNTGYRFTPFSDVPIGVLKIFPGIQFGLFEQIMTEKLSGIVLETFGSGNVPDCGRDLLPIIKKAFLSGAVVVVSTQCPAGTVSLGAYETSSSLKSAGAVSGRDMTTEAAVTKLYYLFSDNISKDTLKELVETDLVGELTQYDPDQKTTNGGNP